MAATVYDYSVISDTANGLCQPTTLQNEIGANLSITIAVAHIDMYADNIHITMKDALSSEEETALDGVVAAHQGNDPSVDPLVMPDGRWVVRSDSRPVGFQTYYTMAGDDSTAGIGMGQCMSWDFSNDDDLVTGDHVMDGWKCKEILATFICPIYTKDGCLYFFDAPWNCYICMDIVVPPGTWYPNPAGPAPASALGLSGDLMYANSGTEWVTFKNYLMRHRMYGSCPMGDELNAEGSAVDALPPGWGIRGRIYTPTSDNTSKGYAELEVHRCHTAVLPGQTLQDIINAH